MDIEEQKLTKPNKKFQFKKSIIENVMQSVDWKIGWWEFLGTALFAYGIVSAPSDPTVSFIYVSCSLFSGIMVTAPFSGGHLNPAVSLAFYMKGTYRA